MDRWPKDVLARAGRNIAVTDYAPFDHFKPLLPKDADGGEKK